MGIFSILKPTDTIYFPGCVAYLKKKEEFENWKRIFSKLEIDFKLADRNMCCGLSALETGYSSEARKIAKKNFENFNEKKIKKIITACPACYRMFNLDYNRFVPEWNIEAVNIWKVILEKIQKKPRIIKNLANEEIAFQDSCYLGRYSGIYEEPREILKLLGYKIKEFKDNRENSICCGCCGELPIINSVLADKIAKEKLSQVKRLNIKKLVVCSTREQELLSKNSSEIEVVLFSDLLKNSLGIKNDI